MWQQSGLTPLLILIWRAVFLSTFFIKKIAGPTSNFLYLALIPLVLMVFDFRENFNTLHLLDTFPYLTAEMVSKASDITGIKTILTNVSMALPVILVMIWAVKYLLAKSIKTEL